MTDEESKSLSDVFRRTVRTEFAFLEGSYKFFRSETEARSVRYSSNAVFVTVFHGRIFDLGVTIGLVPVTESEKRNRLRVGGLFSSSPSHGLALAEHVALAADQASPYHLPSVIGTLGERDMMPPSIRARLDAGTLPTFAADAAQIRSGVRELAELTRQYGDPLLRGDLSAFKKVSHYAHEEGEVVARAMLLKDLPPDAAAKLREAPLSDLYRARDGVLKVKVLAENREEFGAWSDLPPEEFVRRYFERKYPRVASRK